MQDVSNDTASNVQPIGIMLDGLRYTTLSVTEYERKSHYKSIMEGVADMSLENLTLLIQKGLNNCDVATAQRAIDEWRDSGKDTFELGVYIIDTLTNQGFLAKALKLKEKIQARVERVANMDDNLSPLENVG